MLLNLYDGSTDMGQIGFLFNPGTALLAMPLLLRRRITPTAGAHTYRVRATAAGGAAESRDLGITEPATVHAGVIAVSYRRRLHQGDPGVRALGDYLDAR